LKIEGEGNRHRLVLEEDRYGGSRKKVSGGHVYSTETPTSEKGLGRVFTHSPSNAIRRRFERNEGEKGKRNP
jgi:hypothetical protein